ncbi:unnamed protein product [Rotaria sordida]|uniref:HAT C-terminal dimerisation domain-containing protein n=2 Tax=Rotaria sordida TaxID=392033 RepID=A0A814D3A3_9BILA|nr:unnamed protein product [Rotaria sordida]CAF4016547.1 unnamed protein product [Rotaria sordida]
MSITNKSQLNKKDIEVLVQQNDSSISYTKPEETSTMSKYWSEFSQIYVNDLKQNFIICDNCKSTLVYKSSTGSGCMQVHSRSCQSKKENFNPGSHQQKINHYYKSNGEKKIPKQVKNAITSCYMEFVVKDGRAFRLGQGEGFISLVKQLFNAGRIMSSSSNIAVEELLPDPTTVSRYIDRMYVHQKEQLIKICQSMDSYCIVVDFWSESYTGISYCGLLLNHVNTKYQLETYLLGCHPYDMDNKRSPTVRAYIDEILNDFGLKLDKDKFVMTDNEPMMKCTFSLNCTRIGCSSHYVNKQLQHAFTSTETDKEPVNCELAQNMFNDTKHIVATVRRMHKQQKLSKKLILYSDTRFSGAYEMLIVFNEVFNELANLLDSRLLLTYATIDKNLLDDICEFLSTFDTSFEILSDSQRPTLHRVLPLKQLLINKCCIKGDELEGLKQVKHFLGKRLDEKWQISDEHLIATLMHPNLKHFQMCPHLKDRAISLLKEKMFKCQHVLSTNTSTVAYSSSPPTTSSTSTSLPSSSSPSINTNSSSARKRLLLEIYDKPIEMPIRTNIEQELELYLASTCILKEQENDDVLSYWRQNEHLYPTIAYISRRIFAIPACNTSVERLFSTCKNTITDKRTRLGGEKLNKIMFLQKNMNILKEKFGSKSFPTPDDQDTKQKQHTVSLNNESISKKQKTNDLSNNYQNKNEYLIHTESEEIEELI